MASYEKIDYLLRPSKQVERKLIIEILQKLARAKYYIHDYTYIGLGSIYYADFILFHKYLLIDDMICSEIDKIPKRMEFNKPYEFIKLKMEPVSQVLLNIDRGKPHLVWLDYDSPIDNDILSDIHSCIHIFAPGSIILITVPSDLRSLMNLLDPVEAKGLADEKKKERIVQILNDLIGSYYGQEITFRDLGKSKLPKVIAQSLRNFIDSNIIARDELQFFQVINFKYSDNLQMLTIGGIIDYCNSAEKLKDSGIYKIKNVQQYEEPIQISVPPLTMREKMWLDKKIVQLERCFANDQPLPGDMAFEIEIEPVRNFVKYYRYYPSYYETLL